MSAETQRGNEKELTAAEEQQVVEKPDFTIDSGEQKRSGKRTKTWMLPVITAVMIAAAVLFGFLLHEEYRSYEKGVLDVCAEQQDGYVQLVLDQINLNAKRSDDEIIRNIIGTLDSSSNRYWTFSKGEQILFIKDVLETNKYRSLTVDSYYDSKSAAKFLNSLEKNKVSHSQVSMRGNNYMASGARFFYNGNDYRLVLMTNDAVILDNNSYLGAKTAMTTLFAIVLILLMIVPMVLAWKYAGIAKLENQDREAIERQNLIIERSGNELMEAKRMRNMKKAGRETEEMKKDYRYYELKFYLNASHFIIINGNKGEEHPHTWEFSLEFCLPREPFIEFGVVEKEIQGYLKQYQNQLLNDMKPFDEVLPTVENITDYFTGEFSDIIAGFSGILLRVKASETPTRTYVVLCGDAEQYE